MTQTAWGRQLPPRVYERVVFKGTQLHHLILVIEKYQCIGIYDNPFFKYWYLWKIYIPQILLYIYF